ncbi:DUF2252 domain-containing protein [Streptomyces yaizuensis]|uniref:DUF2252 domain-containing protein n=1 Tax=Streptomyces yaizuensis TaxID=2989713 RepID=A0ABQ5NYE9_9ACTN|nr:DUF2252 domain-containing protein [Streptomyces sp. YSPA8]GLF95399.1 DUF2252 domain-containing protein [Streptomyces sp. YSPA8]
MATPAGRASRGKDGRKSVPRSSHGAWVPSADRPDPIGTLERQAAGRVPELLPIRYGRMAVSPFAFLRGAAAVMAGDLAARPHTGLTVQLCGDAHLMNFGTYASPERALLFDLNDFDETLPGPFEWDVERLAASAAVAALENSHSAGAARRAAVAAARSYRLAMRTLADAGELAVWYARIDTTDVLPLVRPENRRLVEAQFARARRRTSLQALRKLTKVVNGERRIISDPPLLEPVGTLGRNTIRKIFTDYRSSLPEDRRQLLDAFRVVDVATKVVGVGSVGTRCFVVLLTGRDANDPLFLQIKEAGRSVLEEWLTPSAYDHHGHRVVAGQLLLQSASDIFLGWVTDLHGRHYYWRQLRDMKGSIDLESMTPVMLRNYVRVCATALAHAHARSGDRIAIASYLGSSDVFDRSIGEFAVRYAEQNARDHSALTSAIASGAVVATSGV